MQGWFTLVYFCLLFVSVAIHREAGILALLVAFALAAMWAYYLRQQVRQQGNTDNRLELVADAFALIHLAGRRGFRTDIVRLARAFRKRSDDVLFWRYRARLLVQRAQLLRWGQDLNWFEQMVLPVPLWLGFLILAGMLWLGATLSIKEWEELLALSLVWVIVPALGYFYYMFLRVKKPCTMRARREALAFLQAHAPPDLAEERCVKLSDLI